MRSIRIGVLGLIVLAVGIAIAGCGSSKTHGEEGTLTLTEPGGEAGKSFGVIGKATQKGIPAGSGFAFSSPLEDASGKAVGELNAFCIATVPSGKNIHGTCSGTASVPGGGFALNVGGKSIGNSITGAIVGGTGKYAGALGTFSSKATGSGESAPETLTFDYTLP
jgi:hypothetical protein